MIKKLIVIAMLIATFGVGSVTYAQATGGSPGRQKNVGKGEQKRWGKTSARRHRRHRRGGRRRFGKNLNPQPLPPG
jgi:hypothetical protein